MLDHLTLLWQAAPPQGGSSPMITFLFLGAAFAIIYFLMLRPQSKIKKEQNNFLSNLKKGQKVVTIGGIHGTIMDIKDNDITVLIATKTHIVVNRSCISVDMSQAKVKGKSSSSEKKDSTSKKTKQEA
ncbi:MAG: preprotein translocase subunit YajC [Saprospiraceae bacterium]|nr:preprotein translocase subunit YajC [Saprospiraceae bacterium]